MDRKYAMAEADWLVCTNCREQVPDAAIVCGHCGHRLKAVADPTDLGEPTSLRSPLRAGALVGAVLLLLSPFLPWLSASSGFYSSAFDMDWRYLGDTLLFRGSRQGFESIGLGLMVLGLVALWWALTVQPGWLGSVAGVLALVIVLAVIVRVVRAWDNDVTKVLQTIDIGVYSAMVGSILLLLLRPAAQGSRA